MTNVARRSREGRNPSASIAIYWAAPNEVVAPKIKTANNPMTVKIAPAIS